MSDHHSEAGDPENHSSAAANRSNCDCSTDWEKEICELVGTRYVVLGIGSRLRGDDAAGPVVAQQLSKRGVKNCFDCGNVPENYLGKIEKADPTDIVFVDVADSDSKPGTIGFYGGGSFDFQSISTHSAGLSPLMNYLGESCSARCWVLSIQPGTLEYGAEMCEPVKKAIQRIVASEVWQDK